MANKTILKKKCNGACRQTLDVAQFDKKSNGQYFGQCRECKAASDSKKKSRSPKSHPLKTVKIDDDLFNTVMAGW